MELYRCLEPGELISGTTDTRFRENWEMACAESILPKRDLAPDAPAVAAE